MTYKQMISVLASLATAALSVLAVLGVGMLARCLWEGLKLGFTFFGYWL